jgi:UTP--glucose-1-phosphate uridylyltransferase
MSVTLLGGAPNLRIQKAVITAAGENQRALPLQTLIDRDGQEKSVLGILIEQALAAKAEEICVVVWPGDETRYAQAAGKRGGCVRFVPQAQPLGYGNAIYCAREFTGNDPFLHLVGDHLYVSGTSKPCAQLVVELAEAEECAVSGVQPTREGLLPRFGAVGGRRVPGRQGLYRVDTVIEKPTPTEAEQRLMVPGIRAGYYLCFFGLHVLTPAVMELLGRMLPEAGGTPLTLSAVLAELARQEQYLALEDPGRRYDIGAPYGLLIAQMALALSGQDRNQVLSNLVELLADREMAAAPAGSEQ